MKRASLLKLCLILSLALVTVSGLVLAAVGVDDQGNPNDPAVNERANACFAGSSMDGKCTNDLEWACGWYLIRFEAGMISRAVFPAACGGLLPELPSQAAPSPTAGCIAVARFGSLAIIYADFHGGNFLASGTETFSHSDCTSHWDMLRSPTVYAPGGEAAALLICRQHGYTQTSTNSYSPLEPGIYYCL